MTTVVLLHGMLGAPSTLDAVRARLSAGLDVRAPWVPGHGPSTAPLPLDFDGAVEALSREVPDGAIVAGYSLGGRLALAMTRLVRVAGLVLIGAHVAPGDEARRAWDDEQAALARRGMRGLVERWERLPVFATQSDAAREAQRATRLAHDPSRIAWALSALGQGRMPDLRPALDALSAPARVLVGGLDQRLVAVTRATSGHVHIVPDRGHNLILEAPDVVAAAIESIHTGLP